MSVTACENAHIESTILGSDDGRKTCTVCFVGQGWGQAIQLHPDRWKEVLEALKVSKWEDLPGVAVRIERPKPLARISRVGHLIEDSWLEVDR